jgi:hypothetical protein
MQPVRGVNRAPCERRERSRLSKPYRLETSALFGGVFFFSFVIAPLIFRKLPSALAASSIRQVFPIYYLAMGGLAGLALILLIASAEPLLPVSTLLLAVVTLDFVCARQLLMPRINYYRDRQVAGDKRAGQWFTRLHASSVAINLAQPVMVAIILLQLSSAH